MAGCPQRKQQACNGVICPAGAVRCTKCTTMSTDWASAISLSSWNNLDCISLYYISVCLCIAPIRRKSFYVMFACWSLFILCACWMGEGEGADRIFAQAQILSFHDVAEVTLKPDEVCETSAAVYDRPQIQWVILQSCVSNTVCVLCMCQYIVHVCRFKYDRKHLDAR